MRSPPLKEIKAGVPQPASGDRRIRTLLVSVIIPVYNAASTVCRAVESAVELPEVGEILLVDDGGLDDSLTICRNLESKHTKVRLLRHADHGNHGAGASRNLGISEAQFSLIAFLDADDYYLPNRFRLDLDILGSDPAVDGVYGATGIEYEDDAARARFHAAGYRYQELTTVSGLVPAKELFAVLFHQHPTVSGEFMTDAITVRRSLLNRLGGFNPELRLQQDTHLWKRLAAVGTLVAGSIEAPVAIRGVHARNRMTDQVEQAKFRDLWWDSLLGEFRRIGLTRGQWKVVRRARASYLSVRGRKREAIILIARCVLDQPSLIGETYGFFDLRYLELAGNASFPIRVLSAKNRLVRLITRLTSREPLINRA